MKRQIIIEIICALFIILFTYTGLSKLTDFEKFRTELGKSPMLTAFAGWVAWMVPVAEIIVAVMLMIGRLRKIALYASFNLMIMFTAYLIAVLNFSFYVPCTCGGVIQRMSWNSHIVFNSTFILLAMIAIVLQDKNDREKTAAISVSLNSP